MITYRGHKFSGYNQPKRNDGSGEHKKMVLAKQGDKVRLIRFGHRGYGHNINPKRKANYLKRSAGIRDKSGKLTKNNKLSANYWSRKTLWPASKPTMAEKRANLDFLKTYRNDIGGALGGSLIGGAVGYKSGYTNKDGKSNRLKRSLIGATAGGLTGFGFGRMSRRLGEVEMARSGLEGELVRSKADHAARTDELLTQNRTAIKRLQGQHDDTLKKQQQQFSNLSSRYQQREADLKKQQQQFSDLNSRYQQREADLTQARGRLDALTAQGEELRQQRFPATVARPSRTPSEELESLGKLRGVKRRRLETEAGFRKRVTEAEARYQDQVTARLRAQEADDIAHYGAP